jgi:hypothetical protein
VFQLIAGCQIVHTQHHILGWADDWFTVSRFEQVAGSQHKAPGFIYSLLREWHVNSHLVAIKVSVESCGHQGM